MKFMVYTVYTYDEYGECLMYLSIYEYRAIEWAKDHFERTKCDTWVEYEEIDFADFEICSYGCYSPDNNIIWQKRERDEEE